LLVREGPEGEEATLRTHDAVAAGSVKTGAPLIEVRSIDWVPDDERHGKLWHQTPLGSLAISSTSPSVDFRSL